MSTDVDRARPQILAADILDAVTTARDELALAVDAVPLMRLTPAEQRRIADQAHRIRDLAEALLVSLELA